MGMDQLCHSTLYLACDSVSMPRFQLIHVSEEQLLVLYDLCQNTTKHLNNISGYLVLRDSEIPWNDSKKYTG